MSDPLDWHYNTIVNAITEGEVVPFFGAGVNLCGRPAETAWQHGRFLPSGGELAEYLAAEFDYPPGEMKELVRVSQYVTVMIGSGRLYNKLHSLFDVDYQPTPLHQFFASLPRLLRAKGYSKPNQLIVTTNYDDLMERAFRNEGEAFDLVVYVAEGEQRGLFLHRPPDGEARLIQKPNEYGALSLEQRPVILKIHGAVDRATGEQDSYVITEDHYIDYLTRTDISKTVPVMLVKELRHSHFLFLGYSLRDWNLRVILHRIWGTQKLSWRSWAIQLDPDPVDREFWRNRDVDIHDVRLEEYVSTLRERMRTLPHAGGTP